MNQQARQVAVRVRTFVVEFYCSLQCDQRFVRLVQFHVRDPEIVIGRIVGRISVDRLLKEISRLLIILALPGCVTPVEQLVRLGRNAQLSGGGHGPHILSSRARRRSADFFRLDMNERHLGAVPAIHGNRV